MNKNKKKISKKMSFGELMQKNPEAAQTLFENGMHCVGCAMAAQESIEQGAWAHGIDPDELIKKLNKSLNKKSTKKTNKTKRRKK